MQKPISRNAPGQLALAFFGICLSSSPQIQYRSNLVDGTVMGYQAGIGTGDLRVLRHILR
ncbi:hypothetical protein [Parapedobacter sp. 2B3]|uniref:hypothetical protein n=1 Tax=Parapedobacter sp. 2B3 TaxID=3342381 RepID=UPI0035B6123D